MLFLDLREWDVPCRSGMIRQKPMLEKLSNRPFNALYIADGDDGMEACKKWLRKEGIKGEHIFVSDDDWNQASRHIQFLRYPVWRSDREGRESD